MEKTSAIILSALKYKDNKLIVSAFSKEEGLLTFLASGINRNIQFQSLCQPMFIVDIQYKKSKTFNIITQIYPHINYNTITNNPNKISICFLISEILKKLLYGSNNFSGEIFDYIKTSFMILDDKEMIGNNFHIKFLISLSKYVGIDITYNKLREEFIPKPYDKILKEFLEKDFITTDNIKLQGSQRSFLLDKIIKYYQYHFDSIKQIKSLEVLQTVFH